ncbi:hypothetical protein AB0J81_09275 [Streptomyces bobili]|uniref:hypothetical protein n=1 Tax=Streptomyces bobili TaxID=67280 RepID=UPI00341257F3
MTPADEITAAVALLRPSSPAVAAHTVAVRLHPDVVSALANWLENTAISLKASTHPDWQDCVAPDALAVARAVLGSSDG